MKQHTPGMPEMADLDRSGMDLRRTIASEGKGLKGFTADHGKTRMRNQKKIYGSLPKKR